VDDKQIIFNILTHKKCKNEKKRNRMRFTVGSIIVECSFSLGKKILSCVDNKQFRTIKDLIDMYETSIIKNF
jgi:hypothetical protein